MDLLVASRQDKTLATVREWVQSGNVPLWADCAGFPRNCGVGAYRSVTSSPSIRTDDYGGVGLLRLELLNWLFRIVSIGI